MLRRVIVPKRRPTRLMWLPDEPLGSSEEPDGHDRMQPRRGSNSMGRRFSGGGRRLSFGFGNHLSSRRIFPATGSGRLSARSRNLLERRSHRLDTMAAAQAALLAQTNAAISALEAQERVRLGRSSPNRLSAKERARRQSVAAGTRGAAIRATTGDHASAVANLIVTTPADEQHGGEPAKLPLGPSSPVPDVVLPMQQPPPPAAAGNRPGGEGTTDSEGGGDGGGGGGGGGGGSPGGFAAAAPQVVLRRRRPRLSTKRRRAAATNTEAVPPPPPPLTLASAQGGAHPSVGGSSPPR